MDAVAAEAGASKRTVYQYFADKEELFAATVLDTVDRGYEYFKPQILALADTDNVEAAICDFARATIAGLTNPELLKMRRLVIAEAERFPGDRSRVLRAQLGQDPAAVRRHPENPDRPRPTSRQRPGPRRLHLHLAGHLHPRQQSRVPRRLSDRPTRRTDRPSRRSRPRIPRRLRPGVTRPQFLAPSYQQGSPALTPELLGQRPGPHELAPSNCTSAGLPGAGRSLRPGSLKCDTCSSSGTTISLLVSLP